MKVVKLWAATLLVVFSFNVPARQNTRIVGGVEASIGEFPFIVSLHERWGHVCGGSLIKKNWVLTAAHCVTGTRLTQVYIGLHDQNSKGPAEAHAIKNIVRHPQYNSSTIDYDFALIELEGESAFPPVAINRGEIPVSDELGRQTMVTTAGWGETSQSAVLSVAVKGVASRLQKVNIPLATSQLCSQGYPGQITDRMICAGFSEGKKDACFGDSGGPLVGQDRLSGENILIGVVSWGEGCARPGRLGVYAKISSVLEWIDQTVTVSSWSRSVAR